MIGGGKIHRKSKSCKYWNCSVERKSASATVAFYLASLSENPKTDGMREISIVA